MGWVGDLTSGPTGFDVRRGNLGENITTRRIDLPTLPQGTLLRIGDTAVVEITGLRTPCSKIERFRKELRRAVTEHRHAGPATLKSAVMTIVGNGGVVRRDDRIGASFPDGRIARSSRFSPRLSAVASIDFTVCCLSHRFPRHRDRERNGAFPE
jgi:MOSC domain-containing protein YiiM